MGNLCARDACMQLLLLPAAAGYAHVVHRILRALQQAQLHTHRERARMGCVHSHRVSCTRAPSCRCGTRAAPRHVCLGAALYTFALYWRR